MVTEMVDSEKVCIEIYNLYIPTKHIFIH